MGIMIKQATEPKSRLKHQANRPKLDPLPLENGARLSRVEFERRYMAMPQIKKAELIEGVVFMPSPVRIEHSRSHAQMITWLGIYQAETQGVDIGDNATLRLDADNEVQPDVFLRIEKASGGTSQISEDNYLEGPPELIVEIAASSTSYDLHDKKRVYRRNGVQEYLVWRVYDDGVDWFHLQDGEYHELEPDAAGLIRSQIFPGLHLDMAALLAGDLGAVLATLRAGLETEAYLAFVTRLVEGDRD